MDTRCFFAPFPVLDLGDIILREISTKDSECYYLYMNREEVVQFITQDNIPQTYEDAIEEVNYWGGLFSTRRSVYWAIALKENNKMIGTAGFNHISFVNSRAEISYDLNPEYWGKGLMLKAIKGILKFADYKLQLTRIQATVMASNQRSIKLLERCGFKEEGFLQRYEVVQGQHRDYYMYARLCL